MPARIEYSLGNVTAGVRERVDGAPVDSWESNCMVHCGHCYRRPVPVVDGAAT